MGWAQQVPAKEENIPYLVTFSKSAETSYGDDDFTQIFFFELPEDYKKPFYVKIYDPDVGGEVDEAAGSFDSKTRFSIYGGKGCYSNKAAQNINPQGNYKSGNLLNTKTFGNDSKYDQKWYTFGPFNPTEGEYNKLTKKYVFKVIAEGTVGNDGNLYRYFLSSSKDKNIAVEGGNAFTFEYSFRLHDDGKQVSHIYPFIDKDVISVKQSNFDWDKDGGIFIYSVAVFNYRIETSGDDEWGHSTYLVKKAELGTSLDIQFKKNKLKPAKNNNVVFYVTNQYGDFLPFYTVPIGGVPEYKGKAVAKPLD